MKRYKVLKSGGSTAPQAWTSPGPNSKKFPIYWPGDDWTVPQTETRDTLGPVPYEDSNLEAEKGETVVVPNVSGLPAHYKIGGKRHSEGGTLLNVPEESFIFSDTASMKIGGPILEHFGKSKDTKKKYTPADLAKKYDINSFRKTLADPNSDDLQRKTAEMMIANYNKKLGMLALVSESKRGFPDGIPQIAMPYLITAAVDPQQVLPLKGTPGQEMMQQGASNDSGEMRYGGNAFQDGPQGTGFQYGGNLPKAQAGTTVTDPFEQGILKQIEQSNTEYQKQKAAYDLLQAQGASTVKKQQLQKAMKSELSKLEANRNLQMTQVQLHLDRLHNMQGDTPSSYNAGALSKEQKDLLSSVKEYSGLKDQINDVVNPANYNPSGNFIDTPFGKLSSAVLPPGAFFGAFDTPYHPGHPAASVNLPPVNITPQQIDSFVDANGKPYPKWMSNKHQIDSVYSQPPIITNRPDTIFNFKYGGVPQYKDGGKTGWYKEGDQYVLYNQGKKLRSQSDNPKPTPLPNANPLKPGKRVNLPVTSSTKSTRVNLGTEGMYNTGWAQSVQNKGYKFQVPDPGIPVDPNTPFMQSASGRAPGQFGLKDWWKDPKLKLDFISRHKWFFDKHPEIKPDEFVTDINKKGESANVGKFQSEYNDLLKSKGLDPYFDSKWGKGFANDSKLGEHTWGAPDPNQTPAPAVADQAHPGPVPGHAQYQGQDPNAPWWLQDVVQTAGAAVDYLGLKKYLPWAPKVEPTLPQATFYDPTRALANNTEQMAVGTQGAGVFAGPQQFSSRFSGIQGEGAKNAANILADYDNRNVGVANQFAGMKADTLNKANEFNANTAKDLYDKTTIANQQYDNSKREARSNLRNSYISAITNRADTQRENAMFPWFHVDPVSGGMGYYTGVPRPLGEPVGTTSGEDWIKSHQNMTEAEKRAWDVYNNIHDPRDPYYDAQTEKIKRGLGYPSGYHH